MSPASTLRDLRIESVYAFLRSRRGNEVHALEPVGHGEWSRAFLFRDGERDRVVRFSATEDDFRKDVLARQLLSSSGVSVPEILEIGTAFAGYFAISARAAGSFLEERDAEGMLGVLPSVFTTLDALREADVSRTSGFGLWRGSDGNGPFASWQAVLLAIDEGPPSPRVAGWREALARNAEAQRAFQAGYARLLTLVPHCPAEARQLIHSDLLNFNVLVECNQVSAVLDWGSAMYGDFLWDLAWFTFWQPWYAPWRNVDIRGAATRHFASIGLDVPRFDERLRCYELAIGLDGLAYQAWAAGPPENLAWTTRRLVGLLNA